MKNLVVILLSIFVFAGCATGPSKEASDAALAKLTPLASKKTVQDNIVEWWRTRLIDYKSAEYDWGQVYPGVVGEKDTVVAGYFVEYMINSKNRFGGYTGFKKWKTFVTADGRVVCSYEWLPGPTLSGWNVYPIF